MRLGMYEQNGQSSGAKLTFAGGKEGFFEGEVVGDTEGLCRQNNHTEGMKQN